jgi:hypothetical protein
MQQLQLENLDSCGIVTKFFDEHSNKACWRGLCMAASRTNLALAAAAGISSGAVLIAQLLRMGAPFAAALPLVQAAPAYAFASFSPHVEHEHKAYSPGVKVERRDEQTKSNVEGGVMHTSLQSAAVAPAAAVVDAAASCGSYHSADNSSSPAKRQLVMHGALLHSAPADVGSRDLIARDADTNCNDSAPAFASHLPKKRLEPSPGPAKYQPSAKHQPAAALPQESSAAGGAANNPSKPLSWLAQLRAQTADHGSDVLTDVCSVKSDPVQSASPAVLRIASASAAVAERRLLNAEPAGATVRALKAEEDSDDDIVALA